MAEEAAQMNAAAAAFCASPLAEPFQVAAVAEASMQAAQRASWAAQSVESFGLEHGERLASEGGDVGWLATLRQVTRQASEAAEQSAQNCKSLAAGVREQCLDALKARKSKVPCKNHLAGRCSKGAACEFSHDAQDMQPRPLMLKSMKQCIFFAKGSCVRGPACPFSHGEEESAEIERYVESLRKEKKQTSGTSTFRR
ncbi:unnamed protein product [Prorocentrum cordatum]|uniref:C3H1-type domain-containing protein n=1 Tax=Prorocentrum cordatum TaxID=2364126 RepID=A0ABN9RGJ8_9DINO|nr:unnamed protein product [Polarella glacialis]